MLFRNLKAELKSGRKLLGCWASLGNAGAVECAALGGFDVIVLDWEHGMVDRSNALPLLLAARAHGCGVIVRVPDQRVAEFKFCLDMGVDGVIIPMTANAKEAKAIVDACRYPPHGTRGAAPGVIRASDYGMQSKAYIERHVSDLLIIPQIEHVDAIEEIAAMGAIDGVDMLFIGPSDLSASMHMLGTDNFKPVMEQVERAAKAIKQAGLYLASIQVPTMDAQSLFKAGYDMIVGTSDANLLRGAAQAYVKNSGRGH
jgi:4-hydroxy-2-oxoheptanedioate aldolase